MYCEVHIRFFLALSFCVFSLLSHLVQKTVGIYWHIEDVTGWKRRRDHLDIKKYCKSRFQKPWTHSSTGTHICGSGACQLHEFSDITTYKTRQVLSKQRIKKNKIKIANLFLDLATKREWNYETSSLLWTIIWTNWKNSRKFWKTCWIVIQ